MKRVSALSTQQIQYSTGGSILLYRPTAKTVEMRMLLSLDLNFSTSRLFEFKKSIVYICKDIDSHVSNDNSVYYLASDSNIHGTYHENRGTFGVVMLSGNVGMSDLTSCFGTIAGNRVGMRSP